MKVRLLRDNGMEKAKAGDVIEVSPAHGSFLTCYGWAEPVKEAREQAPEPAKAEKPAAKPAAKKAAAKKEKGK